MGLDAISGLFEGHSVQTVVLSGIGLFISALVGFIFNESIYLLLAKAMNALGIKNERGLNGLWEGAYRYAKGGGNVTERHVLQLRQIGNYVVGHDIKAQAHGNRIFGRLEADTYFTGTWKNQRAGHDYTGAVQLVLDHNGEVLNGQWIGFDSENKVRNGPWLLKLLDRKISKQAKETALAGARELSLPSDWEDTRPVFEQLIAVYKDAWEKKDPKKILEVFCPDASYHERVGEEPYRGHAGIEKYWNEKVVATQDNINFSLKNLYVTGSIGVAEWEAYFDRLDVRERIHMMEIAVMKLKNNKIYEFREYWRSVKVRDL